MTRLEIAELTELGEALLALGQAEGLRAGAAGERAAIDPAFGRGDISLYRPAEGVSLLILDGLLYDDLLLDVRVRAEEMCVFCNLAGAVELRQGADLRLCIREKSVTYLSPERRGGTHGEVLIRGGEAFRHASVSFTPAAREAFFGSLGSAREAERGGDKQGGASRLPLVTGGSPALLAGFVELCSIRMGNEASERLLRCAGVMRIAAYLLEGEARPEAEAPAREDYETLLIRGIPKRMMRDVLDPPTIEELAREVGVSASKLKSSFKAMYGMPIYAMFKQQKLLRARELLSCTQLSIREIAFQCGYASQAQFSEAFRRCYDITPSQARIQK